jgi:hypothetical protein
VGTTKRCLESFGPPRGGVSLAIQVLLSVSLDLSRSPFFCRVTRILLGRLRISGVVKRGGREEYFLWTKILIVTSHETRPQNIPAPNICTGKRLEI